MRESQPSAQQQELLAQIVKKTEEVQLNALVSELKLQVREKEAAARELEARLAAREQELQRALEEQAAQTKNAREGSLTSKRQAENLQREARIMSGVIHSMGLEMFMRHNLNS